MKKVVKKVELMSKNEIINLVVTSENGLNEAIKNQYRVYCAIVESYDALKDIDKTDVKIQIVAKTQILPTSFDQNISRLKGCIKKGLDITKYASFNAVLTAKKELVKGTQRVVKGGANKGKTIVDGKGTSLYNDKIATIQATNENVVNEILANAEFKALAKLVTKNEWSKANVLKALAQYKA